MADEYRPRVPQRWTAEVYPDPSSSMTREVPFELIADGTARGLPTIPPGPIRRAMEAPDLAEANRQLTTEAAT